MARNEKHGVSRRDFARLVGLTGWYGPWPVYQYFPTVNGVKGSCLAPTIPLIETQP